MATNSEKILEWYRQHEGLSERSGGASNPLLMSWIHQYDKSVQDDADIAWCGIARDQAAIATGTDRPVDKRTSARSWLRVGKIIALQDAQPGDTVVLWRDSPTSWKGHVGIYVRRERTNIIVLGGNQRNRVGEDAYPMLRLLGIRRV